MKYKVVCNHCQTPFIAESDKPGRMKYRCPHCGHVMTCMLGTEERGARSVEREARSVEREVRSEGLTARQRMVATGRTIGRVAQQSSATINTFRQRHANGDLWLFFGFSLLFIVLVIAGLFVGAELAKAIAAGKSWLFRLYLDIVHSF